MNRLFASLLAMGSATSILAQPVITSDIFPLPGDECRYLFAGDVLFPLLPGPDQYWDFTTLALAPSLHLRHALPDTTPGFVLFPGCEVAQTSSEMLYYDYYDLSPTGWKVLGGTNMDPDQVYTVVDDVVLMPFPWTYGTHWEDPYSFTDLEGTMYYDTIRWNADTHGTVLLPGGTEMQVAGFTRYDMSIDTAVGAIYHDWMIELYAPGVRCRIATIVTHIIDHPDFDDIWTSVRVLDDATIGVAENSMGTELELWPVPASGTLNLRWDGGSGRATAQVFDATGRLRLTTTLRPNYMETNMDVSALAPGHYVLRVNDGRRVLAKPFIVE